MHLDRIDPAFGHWLAGFVDGEGCFYIGRIVHHHKNGRDYVNYRCAFTLSVREDDAAVIEHIRGMLGVGRIVMRKPRDFNDYKATARMVAFEVSSKAEVRYLVDIFDRFPLRAKKARDYALWREAVLLWCEIRSGRRATGQFDKRHDWTQLERLHQELKDVRRFHAA